MHAFPHLIYWFVLWWSVCFGASITGTRSVLYQMLRKKLILLFYAHVCTAVCLWAKVGFLAQCNRHIITSVSSCENARVHKCEFKAAISCFTQEMNFSDRYLPQASHWAWCSQHFMSFHLHSVHAVVFCKVTVMPLFLLPIWFITLLLHHPKCLKS